MATTHNNCPAPALQAGDALNGFRVLRVEQIPDIRVTAYEIEHEKTGARVLHLHCDDAENLYSIGFRTPPEDSTGVPHILEHSVLAGSDRYPVKDAFNELMKGTLQTFINAFTYPDKTIYPVASRVRADYFNLARVYTDLVLKPRLLRETFNQEGHHYEFVTPEDPSGKLNISGIVYNEMKGAYSSPDNLMFKIIQENIFPDNAYAFDAGGDPDVIPKLTYEQFREFHHTHYSPSNARFFLYGDISTKDHLEFLAEMLEGFDRVRVDSTVASQVRWSESRSVRGAYPIGRGEDRGKKTAVNVSWLLAENRDTQTALLIQITCGILVGSAAGPLRKALIDSGLGEDLSPVTGTESDFRQSVFTVGLRGTEPDRASAIEKLVLDTLQDLSHRGFDRQLVEGTLHQVEFHGREIVRSSYPYGIVLMGRVYHTWLYDGDPLAGLNFPRAIGAVRREWEKRPDLFQDMVRVWFLDNRHRLLSVLEPSNTVAEEREGKFRKEMARRKAALESRQIEEIKENALALHKFQTEPDSPEAAATLPKLAISDIPRAVETIPTASALMENVPCMRHDIFSNGIAYLDLAFDVSDIPEEEQPLLPLLCRLMTGMGAAGLDYEEMAKRISLTTGGLGCHLTAGIAADGKGNWQKMIFQAGALHRNVGGAVAILADILAAGDLSPVSRMRDLIAEKKNGLHAAVVPSGHVFARRSAGVSFSLPARRDEQWHGRTQLRFISGIADEFDKGKEKLAEKLTRLRDRVIRREKLLINMTADTEGLDLLSAALSGLVERIPGGGQEGMPDIPALVPVHTGIAIPARVSYVVMAMSAPPYTDPLAASLHVAARHLSNGYLYRHIRVQGGAYGGMCQYDAMNGLFAFLSYRDPHIAETLKVYRDAVDFISRGRMEKTDLEKAITGTIGTLDRPMDPSGRGYAAMIRSFAGLDDKARQKLREEILDMTPENVQEAAIGYFLPAAASAVVAIYAAEEELKKANENLSPELVLEALV
ncbi:MAG: insulinase family protein [Deltaproteobacteria bacterium]|nr:insulinase family protein [Deltaproteobacteria bacterium]